MNIAIVGSRDFLRLDRVREYVEALPADSVIVSGGAKGVDLMAERTAKLIGLKTIIHLPNWDEYGKRAGFIRNALIVNDADKVVAFWNGYSKGTRHSIDLAVKAGKKLEVIKP